MSSHLTFGKAVWRAVNTYIEQIGSAESRNEFLSSMLSALQGLVPFDVEGGFFQAAGPACRVLGASERRLKAYTEYYQFRIPFLDDLKGNFPPSYLMGVTTTDWRRYRNTEFVSDFMIPGGAYKTLSCILPGDAYVVALHRSHGAPDFSDREMDVMKVLSPHIRNFTSLWQKRDSQQAVSTAAIGESLPKLSHREAEISALLCSGLAVGEVAARLFISKRTVDAHVAHIYDKLDIRRREALRQKVQAALGWETTEEIHSGCPTFPTSQR